MKNIAPAISPPPGIGDNKPANQAVLDWVHEVELLAKPENVFWCDGSDREHKFVLDQAMKQNVLIELNEQKVPRSYLHRSNPNDVARVEQFTFICTPTKEEAGPTNNWSDPARFAARQSRFRNHRFHLRRAQHANHDADGRARGQAAGQ
jgi:GTP-dependent phosphoenolpyruvate carboxykinase